MPRRLRRPMSNPIKPTIIHNDNVTDMEPIYRRTIADASSLTQAETNLVFDWLSPEDDERICREKANGKTRAALIAIAATNPEQLTNIESQLVMRLRGFHTELQREAQNRPPPDMMELIDNALHSIRRNIRAAPLRDDAEQAVFKCA
ncbi:hypothetical protein N658DRAFT_185655 [Parathielavia hyrcaniae]|uniref:Uncharacterized protein n=1 Tax=Parathielavia hyrcaniae TaxID=113614 RepID=A0AAN6QCD5_9PEZI|nr:hypothetical protein N658DRAFT_185655 [Parathielavia hyrcaniae]